MKKDEIYKILKMTPPKRGGEKARLFPVLSETSKEGRAASIFLSCLSLVPEFANRVLAPIGRPIGTRSKVYCVTEIEFDDDKENRPDGLIGVRTGNTVWRALVEFKVGSELGSEQVERYLRVARQAGLDSVITISNDIVPDPTFSPVNINRQLTRSVALYHISWMQIFTHAQVLLSTDAIADSDHGELIEEFIRFLSHKSTGIKGFTQMPSAWPTCVERVRGGSKLQKKGVDEQNVISAWMQEERELSFILSQSTHGYCDVRRGRAESKDGTKVTEKHTSSLIGENELSTQPMIKNAAAPLEIKLRLVSRSVQISMELKAPRDKSRATACINWLSRQIPKTVADCIFFVNWPGRTQSTSGPIEEIRNNPNSIIQNSNSTLPTTIIVARQFELGSKFSSRKGIIEIIEKETERFYAEIGANLSEWVPAPKPSKNTSVAQEIIESATYGSPENAS